MAKLRAGVASIVTEREEASAGIAAIYRPHMMRAKLAPRIVFELSPHAEGIEGLTEIGCARKSHEPSTHKSALSRCETPHTVHEPRVSFGFRQFGSAMRQMAPFHTIIGSQVDRGSAPTHSHNKDSAAIRHNLGGPWPVIRTRSCEKGLTPRLAIVLRCDDARSMSHDDKRRHFGIRLQASTKRKVLADPDIRRRIFRCKTTEQANRGKEENEYEFHETKQRNAQLVRT